MLPSAESTCGDLIGNAPFVARVVQPTPNSVVFESSQITFSVISLGISNIEDNIIVVARKNDL